MDYSIPDNRLTYRDADWLVPDELLDRDAATPRSSHAGRNGLRASSSGWPHDLNAPADGLGVVHDVSRSSDALSWFAVPDRYQQNDGFVFCKPDGTPYHPERFSREFDRKQEQFNRARAGEPLPRLTLHGLRHTWATLALQAGIDIKIVSDRLNHSSAHITCEIYTHVTPPMRSDAADRVAEQIFGSA